jgi:hypothetical protein
MTFSFVKIDFTFERFAVSVSGVAQGLAAPGTNKTIGNRVSRMLSAHTDSGHPVPQCELNEVRMQDQRKAGDCGCGCEGLPRVRGMDLENAEF